MFRDMQARVWVDAELLERVAAELSSSGYKVLPFDPAHPPDRGVLIVRQAQLIARDDPASQLYANGSGPEAIDFDMVVRAFRAGDPAVRQLVEEVGHYLGVAIANLVGVLNVERIVLTGPVAEFGAALQETIAQEVRRRALPLVARSTEIAIARESSDMILQGLAALLLHNELGLTRLAAR